TTIVYLDIILYSVGGVVGTMHHMYFSGAPAIHMALGAFFSAMEVIPLVLLSYEAWRFMQLGKAPGQSSVLGTSSADFPHKWAVMFLIAVGFWNFLGAGVFGLSDQPADGQLLRNRHGLHRQPRPRSDDGGLRDARPGVLHVRGPLFPP